MWAYIKCAEIIIKCSLPLEKHEKFTDVVSYFKLIRFL